MELAVHTQEGKKSSAKAKLSDSIFGIEPNEHVVYLDVKQYRAATRSGNHKAKERGEIAGSTKKIKKQKGTGTARAGSIKSPVFRGGGRIFGPQPRDYAFKLNKKVKKLARRSVLSDKASRNAITLLDHVSFDQPSTKEFLAMLGNLSVRDKKVLLIMKESNKNVSLSARNLKGVEVVSVSEINTYDVLNADHVLIDQSALQDIETSLS